MLQHPSSKSNAFAADAKEWALTSIHACDQIQNPSLVAGCKAAATTYLKEHKFPCDPDKTLAYEIRMTESVCSIIPKTMGLRDLNAEPSPALKCIEGSGLIDTRAASLNDNLIAKKIKFNFYVQPENPEHYPNLQIAAIQSSQTITKWNGIVSILWDTSNVESSAFALLKQMENEESQNLPLLEAAKGQRGLEQTNLDQSCKPVQNTQVATAPLTHRREHAENIGVNPTPVKTVARGN